MCLLPNQKRKRPRKKPKNSASKPSTFIFDKTGMTEVIDRIVQEPTWNNSRGTGRIGIQDNRAVQHAGYYRDATRKGYRIGV